MKKRTGRGDVTPPIFEYPGAVTPPIFDYTEQDFPGGIEDLDPLVERKNPDAISEGERGTMFPTRPRFTLDELREIRIARGDGDSTIAGFTFIHAGKTVDKYATFDTLTHAEREAALLFILKYGGTAAIRRRGKPRGRAVPRIYGENGGAIKYSQPPELAEVDIASLTPTDPGALLENIPADGDDQSGAAREKVLPGRDSKGQRRKQSDQ